MLKLFIFALIIWSWSAIAFAQSAAVTDAEQTAQSADFLVEGAQSGLRLMGFTVRESASTAAVATVILRHGGDATCTESGVFAYIELDANQSVNMSYGEDGLRAGAGICADVVAGTVDVNVHTNQ